MVEEQTTSAPAQASAPEKKPGGDKTLKVVVIVIVILAVVGVAGYFGVKYLLQRAGEKVVEGVIESNIDGDVDYDYDDDGVSLETEEGTTSVGSKAEWPSDMPSSVPKYNEGSISYSSTTIEGWNLMFEDIKSVSLTSYKSELEDSGWTIVSTSSSTQSGESIQAENDTYDLYIMAIDEGKSATLTVTEKSD